MGLFDKLKLDGTKMVGNYKAASASGSLDIRGSAIEYKTGEISGYSDGKGSLTGGASINALIAQATSSLHREASTNETPRKVKDILDEKSYTQKYHYTALNNLTPDASKIDEGTAAKFIPPSSPSVNGRNINTKKYSTAYSSTKTYQSSFDSYKTIDPSIASKF
jgi:hypothetical protein